MTAEASDSFHLMKFKYCWWFCMEIYVLHFCVKIFKILISLRGLRLLYTVQYVYALFP